MRSNCISKNERQRDQKAKSLNNEVIEGKKEQGAFSCLSWKIKHIEIHIHKKQQRKKEKCEKIVKEQWINEDREWNWGRKFRHFLFFFYLCAVMTQNP